MPDSLTPPSLIFVERGGPQAELELTDYLAILRRRWIWFALPLIVVPALAFLYTSRQADSYNATAEVLLGDTAAQEAIGASSQNTSFRDRLLENELSLALSDAAFVAVAERFAVEVDDVPEADVSADASSDVLIFSASSTSPQSAADTANAWAETYVALKQAQAQDSITSAISQLQARLESLQAERRDVRADLVELQRDLVLAAEEDKPQAQLLVEQEQSEIDGEVELIDAQIDAVVNSVNDLELSGELALSGSARVVNQANVPVTPTNPPPSRNVALGVVVGAILGAALALLRENLDTAIRSETDVEALGVLSLGVIPKVKGAWNEHALASFNEPDGSQAEAYQKVQAAVQFLTVSEELSSILVTSARQGDGKTTTASNLAIAMARAGKRTLLIDADLRRPRLHKVHDLPQSPGLTNVVLDIDLITDAARPLPAISNYLVAVTAGTLPPHPAGFTAATRFGRAVHELETMADFTIFDAAPVLPVADTLSLASHVDGVLVVVQAGTTTKDDLAETLDALTNAGGKVVGAVLVGAKDVRDVYRYKYDSTDKLERMTDPGDAAEPVRSNGSAEGAGRAARSVAGLSSSN